MVSPGTRNRAGSSLLGQMSDCSGTHTLLLAASFGLITRAQPEPWSSMTKLVQLGIYSSIPPFRHPRT